MTLALAAHAAPPELAPSERALTLAFAERGGARTAFLVAAAGEDSVSAVALGPGDAFAALAARSEAELTALLRDGPREQLALAELLPVLEGAQHVAGGANYAAHGAEVGAAAPFLFPKLVTPTPWQSQLAVQPGWLLDYEVELALVFDRDIESASDLTAARAGVFLIDDFTERAQLALEADLSTPGVGAGFADAKGKPGFLPTGPFLVVPRDWRAFVRDCEIRLHVNGRERQRARGGQMVWDVDELVRRTLALGATQRFRYAGEPIALTPGRIPRGTGLLTGTPAGVAFRTPGTGFVTVNAAWWAASFAFLDGGVQEFVTRRWVEKLREDGVFLRAGDVVIAEGRGLGAIVTQIVVP
jgi:2-keto-4-pentenoate hydratase/2-oxohepta-3-ene-1,7-dioic acid hydratase in catechol pathway